MIVGEIYYFGTDQAVGHDWRNKYHVYLCEGDWSQQGYAFLFINKSNSYGDGYELRKADYGFFPLPYSYVRCGNLVFYSQEDLDEVQPQLLGRLTDAHLGELCRIIEASETMPGRQIALACAALHRFR